MRNPAVRRKKADVAVLCDNLKRHLKGNFAQMRFSPGQVLNRYISGAIFIVSGSASLFQVKGDRRVYLDRLEAGRLFVDPIFDPEAHRYLHLVADTAGEISVVKLVDINELSHSITQQLNNALLEELHRSCATARNQICTLRCSSAKDRLTDALRIASISSLAEDLPSGWRLVTMDRHDLLEMCHVSYRQFKRLLPELCADGLIRLNDRGIEVSPASVHES